MLDRHHLLEIILWPEENGTFRTIINSRNRLKELHIYSDFKLTIKTEHGMHTALHAKYRTGIKLTDEAKAKMSAAKLCKPKSAETKAKMSAAKLGKPRTAETKAKISEKMRGRKRPPFSAEWRAKMSSSHKKQSSSNKYQKENNNDLRNLQK